MSKFSVNYEDLENGLKKRHKLADVKHKLEVVAFDIVKFHEDDVDQLWQIQNADDGDYIVALYDESKAVKVASAKFEVMINKTSEDVSIFYKNDPILRLSAKELGVPNEELYLVKRYLPSKLAENKQLLSSLLNKLSKTALQSISSKYPELF